MPGASHPHDKTGHSNISFNLWQATGTHSAASHTNPGLHYFDKQWTAVLPQGPSFSTRWINSCMAAQ